MTAKKRLLKKLGLSLGVFLVLLVALELALRAKGYGRSPAKYYDPEIGWLFVPDQEREMLGPKQVELGPMRTNALGFRGPVFPREKPASGRRIACLGDSFTFGWGVADGETYPVELQERLPADQVMNFGNPGNNVWNSLQVYRRFVRPYAPDVVVLGLYLNDAQPEGGGPRHTDSFLFKALGRTALVEAFHKHVRRELSFFDAGRTPEQKAYLKRYHEHWHAIENDPTGEVASVYWGEALAQLDELAREVEQDGARLLVVFFPSHEQWVRHKKVRERGGDLEAARAKTKSPAFVGAHVTEELGVEFLDLYDAFTASEVDPFGELDAGHPSALGYELAARAIAERL